MILGIALFFLILRLERKGRQAFVRATAPKIGHYVWLAGMLMLLFPVWTRDRNGFREYLIPILVTLLFLAAETALLFWRRAGLALSLVYLWAALPLKELTVIAVTEKDRAALSAYSPAGMMGVYAADRYLLDRASALALAAFCLTVWMAVYYGRRRLLFREEVGAFRKKLALFETSDASDEEEETIREYRELAEKTDAALALLEEELAAGKAPGGASLSEAARLIAAGMKAGLEPAITDALSAAGDLAG